MGKAIWATHFAPHLPESFGPTIMQCAVLIRATQDYLSQPQQNTALIMNIIRQILRNSASSPKTATELDKERPNGLLIVQWAMQIIHNRLLVALRPGLQSSVLREEETQRLS